MADERATKTATPRIPEGWDEGGGLKSAARKSRVTGDACLENIHPPEGFAGRAIKHTVTPASFFLLFSPARALHTARRGIFVTDKYELYGRAIQNFQVILNSCQTAAAKRDEEG